MLPAETLNANGTVNQASIGVGGRGSDIFDTYTTLGTPGGETWRPKFNYFAMQYLQVTGLPAGFTPTTDLIRGLQLSANVARAGDIETSNARINRLHAMSVYSTQSNQMSTFTDCPGREKLPYGADYVQPIGSLNVNFDYAAYLRNMEIQLVEGQSKQGADAGNVALKTPVYDWGYSGQFGDEINWGSSIVQVPWLLHKLYGDTQTMREHFDAMKTYMDFVARRKATDYVVTALLADWVSSEQTSQQIFGTWGYYLSAKYMSRDGGADRPQRRRRDLQRARGEHQDRVQRPLLQHDAAALHGRGQRRHDRRDAGRAGDRARRRPRARGRAAVRAAGAGGQHLRLPAVRRRPALQRRPRRARPGRALAAGGRPLRRAVGRHAGEHAAELRLHAAADRRAPGGHEHDARALDARRLAEPRDPAADRGVVPHRRGRHQAGRELDRLPRAGDQADPGR